MAKLGLGLFTVGAWNNRQLVYQLLKFILGCRFTFKAYAKNVREKTAKYILKTTEILMDVDGHVLT